MTHQELKNICYSIVSLVGKQTDFLTPEMNTDERMKARAAYDMICESLLTMCENRPQQAAALDCYTDKFGTSGTTPTFKKFVYYRAAGMLYLEGNLVLNGAQIAQVWEYLISH